MFAGGRREDGEVGVLKVGRQGLLGVQDTLVLLGKGRQVVVAVELGREVLEGLVGGEGLLGRLRVEEIGANRVEGGEVLCSELLARGRIQVDTKADVG